MDVEEIDEECQHEAAEEMGRTRLRIFKLCPECGEEILETLPTFGKLEVRVTVMVPLTKPAEEHSEEEMEALVAEVENQVAPDDESVITEITWWEVR